MNGDNQKNDIPNCEDCDEPYCLNCNKEKN